MECCKDKEIIRLQKQVDIYKNAVMEMVDNCLELDCKECMKETDEYSCNSTRRKRIAQEAIKQALSEES